MIHGPPSLWLKPDGRVRVITHVVITLLKPEIGVAILRGSGVARFELAHAAKVSILHIPIVAEPLPPGTIRDVLAVLLASLGAIRGSLDRDVKEGAPVAKVPAAVLVVAVPRGPRVSQRVLSIRRLVFIPVLLFPVLLILGEPLSHTRVPVERIR